MRFFLHLIGGRRAAGASVVAPPPAPPARRADLMLLGATFFWGWTFPVVKEAIAIMPVFAFLALRFALAALLMPLATRRARLPGRAAWRSGAWLGLLLFLSFAFQTLGLERTSASNCAFITGLNVVWVALATARGARVWAAVGLAVCGLWLLAAPDEGINLMGDGLTLLCSLFIAWHILALQRLDKSASSGELATVQFTVVAAASFVTSVLWEDSLLPSAWDVDLIAALLVTVLGATIFSFWAQTHYQRHTTAVRAALIFVMEPVFAAAFAVLFYGERLPSGAWVGAALVVGAMLVAGVRQKQGD